MRGYYQFGLDKSSRDFTAFSTHCAHWQFKCLTFGLKNAPPGSLVAHCNRSLVIFLEKTSLSTSS